MTGPACVAFLQWALPRMGMRWPGFRKVRKQVCKRIARRIAALGLPGPAAYRDYLEAHPDEWPRLDEMCRVTISRFFRDRSIFEHLEKHVLPALARERREIRAWSAGCAGGEEPYSLGMLWRLGLAPAHPRVALRILATDADPDQLARAREGCYGAGSLKEVPAEWRATAFERRGALFCVRPEFREAIEFQQQDIRQELPQEQFELVLCRNLVFTYFAEELQRRLAAALRERLAPGGVLVLGKHEHLPD